MSKQPILRTIRCSHTGKTVYAQQADADRELAVFATRQDRNPHGHPPVRAYQCAHCGFWHLTHQPDWPYPASEEDERTVA
jgi:hypothetical protein